MKKKEAESAEKERELKEAAAAEEAEKERQRKEAEDAERERAEAAAAEEAEKERQRKEAGDAEKERKLDLPLSSSVERRPDRSRRGRASRAMGMSTVDARAKSMA